MKDLLQHLQSGHVPDDAELVSERLLRRVFHCRLEDGTRVFVKQHLFPLLRVRLRYLLRPSPTACEQHQLECARSRGFVVPEVLAEETSRGLLGPRSAVLVTRALEVDGEASHAERIGAARSLATAGIWHPDLHPGNVLREKSGQLAFLDFQSARSGHAPIGEGRARLMLAKAADAAERELGEEGLSSLLVELGETRAISSVLAAIGRIRARERASRRRHALRTSSGFVRESVGLLGVRVRVRGEAIPAGRPGSPATRLPGAVGAECPGAGVLRYSARGSLMRRIWLAAVAVERRRSSTDPAFLAWEREGPWPWARQHLYIRPHRNSGGDRDIDTCDFEFCWQACREICR